MTYVALKFEAAMSNGLGGNAFTRNHIIWLNVAQYPWHHVTYAPAKFDVAHSMVKEKMHLQENTLFDLDLGVKVTLNVAQYPRHHVAYAPAKFDIATSQG